tara:strand:- start:28519 stop:29256 length:738 start_codon:yes stop_codon:yes gene_type:complete
VTICLLFFPADISIGIRDPGMKSLEMIPRQSVLQALTALSQSLQYAHDSGVDVWQFAIEHEVLREMGLTVSDIRWLIHKKFVIHRKEITAPGDPTRSFSRLSVTSITQDAAYVLTESGIKITQRLMNEEIAPPDLSSRELVSRPLPSGNRNCPTWSADHRELWYEERLVKRFRVPAQNQVLVLTVFEEESWPEFIDDPLPSDPKIDPRRRLQATVKSLNRCQAEGRIRFHTCGGDKIFWSSPGNE